MNWKLSLSLPIFLLSGCIHYVPLAVSTTSIGPNEEVVGVGTGIGDGFAEAVKFACKVAGADTMVNVFADAEYQYFLIGGWTPTGLVRVYGTLIKYKSLHHSGDSAEF